VGDQSKRGYTVEVSWKPKYKLIKWTESRNSVGAVLIAIVVELT
jgi:hypothetical protein